MQKNHRAITLAAISLFLILSLNGYGQKKIPDDFCITPQEQHLFNSLNTLLTDYGKKPLKLSASLSYVAKLHVEDLLNNRPDTSICNLSSWSDKGNWTPCCFNRYVPSQECMWKKPKELTPYPYRGYELAGYFQDEFNVDTVVNVWSSQREVLDMLLATGYYAKKEWACMGVAMNQHYVSVWFGQRPDKVKSPQICDTLVSDRASDTSLMANKPQYFYLIIASFQNEKDAKEAIRRYKKNGFENVGILKANNRVRVFLDKFTELKEAIYAKQNLPYSYRDAWIYKQ